MPLSRESCVLCLAPMLLVGAGGCASSAANVRLSEWERGLAVERIDQPSMVMYLWFYEWNMFGAVESGQHTPGSFTRFDRQFDPDGSRAVLRSDDITLEAVAVRDGVDLELTVTNRSDHDWPEVAGIIPCFNPGPEETRNAEMANTNTYFVGPDGLSRQDKREIHFNAGLRERIDARSNAGRFVWAPKWPTSPIDAVAGLIMRESDSGRWVTGIAWERFLSAQGHNPWECMHLCVRVGPLRQGETHTIRGRIYLFPGDRDDCLERYRADFGRGSSVR